jgi:hypothetical protein
VVHDGVSFDEPVFQKTGNQALTILLGNAGRYDDGGGGPPSSGFTGGVFVQIKGLQWVLNPSKWTKLLRAGA